MIVGFPTPAPLTQKIPPKHLDHFLIKFALSRLP